MGNRKRIINDGVSKITKVRFKIFAAVIMKNSVCRGVTPCVWRIVTDGSEKHVACIVFNREESYFSVQFQHLSR
jgi:hypothetical protein